MSTSKVKTIERQLSVTSGSKVGTTLTLDFGVNHYLKINDVVKYRSNYTPMGAYLTVASVPTSTSITATVSNALEFSGITDASVIIPFYSAGQTGLQPAFSFPAYDTTGIIQFVANGTGGAAFTLSASLNGVNWIDLASFTLGTSDGATDYLAIAVPWAYLAVNISSIGANTTLTVLRMG